MRARTDAQLLSEAETDPSAFRELYDRYAEAIADLAGWLREGKLESREYVVEGGVRAFPGALLKLFEGENTGKLVLAV